MTPTGEFYATVPTRASVKPDHRVAQERGATRLRGDALSSVFSNLNVCLVADTEVK